MVQWFSEIGQKVAQVSGTHRKETSKWVLPLPQLTTWSFQITVSIKPNTLTVWVSEEKNCQPHFKTNESTHLWEDLYPSLTAALFVIAKTENTSNVHLHTGEEISKLWHSYTTTGYSAIKRNWLLIHVTIWMNLMLKEAGGEGTHILCVSIYLRF